MHCRSGPRLWALLASGLLAGCAPSGSEVGTAVFLETAFSPEWGVTQLRFQGTSSGGPVFGPEVLPAQESEPLVSPQSVRVLLADALAGHILTLRVEGLRQGQVVAETQAELAPELGREVVLHVRLQEPPPPPPPPCADCAGCCEAGVCRTPSPGACGTGGQPCVACDPRTADACTSEGCRCGVQDPCGAGQRCFAGLCICDGSSCAGCCEGNSCAPGNKKSQCGIGGAACVNCTGSATCSAGACL